MCLTIPTKIISINDNIAKTQDYQGNFTDLNISSINNLKPGDWLLHTVGQVTKKIDPTEVQSIIDLLAFIPNISPEICTKEFQRIITKSKSQPLSKQEIIFLLKTSNKDQQALLNEANITRQTHINDFFCIHGIIELSNHCQNNCHYCGIQNNNKELKRYRMNPDEIIECATNAVQKRGYKLLVLQSGEDLFYTTNDLINIIQTIKSINQVFIFLRIGERNFETYKTLKQAGANGVLFRFETSNPGIYEFLHSNQNYQNRLKHLDWFKHLDYFIATGSIIGLPGQLMEDIADDILYFTENNFPMASFGPFIPSQNTSLQNNPPGDIDLTLKTIAILRLLNPAAKIPVVTALETLAGENGRKMALQAGANSLMFNLTPEKYRSLYSIYPEKYFKEERLWEKYGLFHEPESYNMPIIWKTSLVLVPTQYLSPASGQLQPQISTQTIQFQMTTF